MSEEEEEEERYELPYKVYVCMLVPVEATATTLGRV